MRPLVTFDLKYRRLEGALAAASRPLGVVSGCEGRQGWERTGRERTGRFLSKGKRRSGREAAESAASRNASSRWNVAKRRTSDRTVFLVNPASDNGATGRRWPQLAHELAQAGLTGDALFSSGPGELGGLARRAADEGALLLVVVGGDGSVFEVANGIAERDGVEVTMLARGTGCDFVRSFGLSGKPAVVAATALNGVTRELDLGRATYRSWSGKEESAWFANVASAGMSGAIAERANNTTKALGGKVSYAWATLAVFARWQNGEVRVTVDGETRSGRMQDVVVANGRYFGGGMKICPDAEPDDGLFDVLLIGDVTRVELLQTMPKLYRGTHLPHKKGELLQGRVVTVESAEPLPIELDGEQPGTTPARFEVVPGTLRVRVPAS